MNTKQKWLIGLAAGVGAAAVAYKLFLSNDIPDDAQPAQPFDIGRYLGKWYEIARLPNSLEKDITKLTETYSADKNGDYRVFTKGYHTKKKRWEAAGGTLKFAGQRDKGMLKVSYFAPFYANYNVLAVDPDYRYALVSGSGLGFLWILSREKTIPDEVKAGFLTLAGKVGFEVDKLEWPAV